MRIEITMLVDRDNDGRHIVAGKDLQLIVDPESLDCLELGETVCNMARELLERARVALGLSPALRVKQ